VYALIANDCTLSFSDPESLKEHFDSPDILEKKSEELVKLIKEAKHFTVFTGAGVSTSAGIPDFRGPQGVWTLQAQGKKRTEPTVSTLKAIPTPTHMALVKLQSEGILKYLISQNVDGLHRRSGILPEKVIYQIASFQYQPFL
jgi:mono-ADP-ribosyltransferase sirtuin 6